MDIVLQAGLGLLVATVVIWLLIIKRKAKGIGTFLYGGVVSAACAVALVMGIIGQFSDDGADKILPKEDMLAFAGSLASAGAFEQAEDVIDDYSEEYGYDEECSLLTARIYALQGMYDKADGIYSRLAENEDYAELIKEEQTLVAEYANPSEESSAPDVEKLMEAVNKSFEKMEGADPNFSKYAENIKSSLNAYAKYAQSDFDNLSEEEKKEIENLHTSLITMRNENPEAFNVSAARDAFLQLNLLKEDYKTIAKVMDENATENEMAIASELYINGIINTTDFPDEFAEEFADNAEVVGEHLAEEMDVIKEDMSSKEATQLESTVESWEVQTRHPELATMKNELTEIVEAGNTNVDSSKVNLEIAKVEHYLEDEAKRDEHIYQAILDSPDSDDPEYSQPMMEVLQVINKDSSENNSGTNITNVSTYVDQALNNSLPMGADELVPEKVQSDSSSDGSGGGFLTGDIQVEMEKEFSQAVTECVSKVISSITIGNINKDKFEEISARIIVSTNYASTAEELKDLITVYDCGLEIKDFTIEKVTYNQVKTILICDNSGSMGGSIDDLKNAIMSYANEKNPKEKIGVVKFTSGIEGQVGFGASASEFKAFVDGMEANGGTAIYDSLIGTINGFSTSGLDNNVIIVMTDGQDGSAASDETINTELAELAKTKNITVYTLGLGDVDTAYLNSIASAGNGNFVYASDSVSLQAFYELLHSQVDNQYIVKYKAKDTLTQSNRTLEVKIESENLRDMKYYSLVNGGGSDDGSQNGSGLPVGTVNVNGLSVRTAYKSNVDINNTLTGSGFSKDAAASIKLNGNLDYDISLTYKNENSYTMTIPSTIAVGTYDVEVSIDGKRCIIKDGFTVCENGSETSTVFGPYVFTSLKKTTEGNKIILSGDVTMNGWLKFKGNVTLTGDLSNDYEITVVDESGSYVMFDPDTAEGLGKVFAEKNIAIDLPALETFSLYNDYDNRLDYENYAVDKIQVGILKVFQVMYINTPGIKLYPNEIKLEFGSTTSALPFQELIFNPNDSDSSFTIENECTASLTDRNIGVKIDIGGESEKDYDNIKDYHQWNMFNSPVYLDMSALKISIDTIAHEYTFGGMIQFKNLFGGVGIGAEVTFDGFTPDKFSLTLDKDMTFKIGPVPLTLGNFTLGAEEIAAALEERDFTKLILRGALDISAFKVSEIFPALEEFVGDVSLLKMPETEFKVGVNPFSFEASASLYLLEEIKLANATVQLGTFDYSSEILDLDNVEVNGINATLEAGIMWDILNCTLEITGEGELSMHSRFTGIELEGTVLVDIDWWLFNTTIDEKATVLLGVYYTESGSPQFTLALAYRDGSKTKRLYYYIDENGNTGDKNGTV